MWWVITVASYIFLSGFFSALTKLKLAPAAGVKDCGYQKPATTLAVFTGIFWPLIMLVWAGYFAAKSLEN